MTVKQLKKFLEDVPDDSIVVIEGSDHSYMKAYAQQGTALYEARSDNLYEDHGGDPDDEEKRVNMLLIA